MSAVLREINISTYLGELTKKNGCAYSYGIINAGSGFHVNIRKHTEDGKAAVVFNGPMGVLNASMDMYYVDFPKAGVRCMIYFFM